MENPPILHLRLPQNYNSLDASPAKINTPPSNFNAFSNGLSSSVPQIELPLWTPLSIISDDDSEPPTDVDDDTDELDVPAPTQRRRNRHSQNKRARTTGRQHTTPKPTQPGNDTQTTTATDPAPPAIPSDSQSEASTTATLVNPPNDLQAKSDLGLDGSWAELRPSFLGVVITKPPPQGTWVRTSPPGSTSISISKLQLPAPDVINPLEPLPQDAENIAEPAQNHVVPENSLLSSEPLTEVANEWESLLFPPPTRSPHISPEPQNATPEDIPSGTSPYDATPSDDEKPSLRASFPELPIHPIPPATSDHPPPISQSPPGTHAKPPKKRSLIGVVITTRPRSTRPPSPPSPSTTSTAQRSASPPSAASGSLPPRARRKVGPRDAIALWASANVAPGGMRAAPDRDAEAAGLAASTRFVRAAIELGGRASAGAGARAGFAYAAKAPAEAYVDAVRGLFGDGAGVGMRGARWKPAPTAEELDATSDAETVAVRGSALPTLGDASPPSVARLKRPRSDTPDDEPRKMQRVDEEAVRSWVAALQRLIKGKTQVGRQVSVVIKTETPSLTRAQGQQELGGVLDALGRAKGTVGAELGTDVERTVRRVAELGGGEVPFGDPEGLCERARALCVLWGVDC